MGEETALADLILPDCPYLERWEPESMPNSLWPWLGIRQPVIKSLGESRENRIMMRDIIWKLDPDGKRGMKKYWNFKDGEDYMRQHFDNVPGLKEAGGLDFLKKHGVWPIYGKLNPRTGKISDKTGREIEAEYGLHMKEIVGAQTWPGPQSMAMARSVRTAKPSAFTARARTTWASPPAIA